MPSYRKRLRNIVYILPLQLSATKHPTRRTRKRSRSNLLGMRRRSIFIHFASFCIRCCIVVGWCRLYNKPAQTGGWTNEPRPVSNAHIQQKILNIWAAGPVLHFHCCFQECNPEHECHTFPFCQGTSWGGVWLPHLEVATYNIRIFIQLSMAGFRLLICLLAFNYMHVSVTLNFCKDASESWENPPQAATKRQQTPGLLKDEEVLGIC